MAYSRPRTLVASAVVAAIGLAPALAASQPDRPAASAGKFQADKSPVLVTVNRVPITENQFAFYRLVHHLADNPTPEVRKKLIERLVENELMRQFLIERRSEADPKRLAAAIERIKADLRRRKLDPDQVLGRLGYNSTRLRRDLSLPLAWEIHLGRIMTPQTVRDEFERHREQYDGTEIRASQIFRKVASSASAAQIDAAEQKLAGIRADIVAGKIAFPDAARRYSEAPSAKAGGDVGYFSYRGKMPLEISRVALSLKVGQISPPFRTPFGVHLYKVTDRRPGNWSLEDVRPVVIRQISQELWDSLVAQARNKAKIEWREGQDEG